MPTDEQRALWAAIRANPLDDTPRLVYADWLQEHGDEARAEFIRVQCALEKLGPDRRKGRKERGPLETKHDALLNKHAAGWLLPFRERLKGTTRDDKDEWLERLNFRRGFLDGNHFGLDTARALAEAADDLEPVDRVSVFEMGANYRHSSVATIGKWPGAGCVTCFSVAWTTAPDVPSIVRPNYMRNLAHLGLWHGKISDASVAELAAWPGLVSLRSLDLQSNPAISDAGAKALIESPHLTGLQRLALRGTGISKKWRDRLRERFGTAVGVDD